jgi:pantetheine-phosphate adenylyltransferase
MRLGLYAGSFDPVTVGHLAVIEKASALVDRLYVVVAVNSDKQTWFTLDERVRLLRESVRANVEVTSTTGWVVTLATELGATWLFRGVRDGTDAEAELRLAALNASVAPGVTTVFITADPRLVEVSSSRLKAIALAGGSLEGLCPAPVARALKGALARPAAATREGTAL